VIGTWWSIRDPERVVLTGGLSGGIAKVLPGLLRHFLTLFDSGSVGTQTEIRTGELFDFVSVIGASYLRD